MGSIKRVSLVATLALVALALTAASASADIEEIGTNGAYVGEVQGSNTGPDPTLETDTTTITCAVATVGGDLDGDWDSTDEASASLDFTWDECNIVGGADCTVDPINDVSVHVYETSPWATAPDALIVNDFLGGSSIGETFIGCLLGSFNCTASSDPEDGSGLTDSPSPAVPSDPGSEVTATVDSATQESNIDDTVVVSGVGCPTSGQWVAEYTITVPAAGLEATGTQ
jgi:hypothetical protein